MLLFEPLVVWRLGPFPACLTSQVNAGPGIGKVCDDGFDKAGSVFIISSLAGILKSQNVYFFFSTILGTILNNSDILFGSDYK